MQEAPEWKEREAQRPVGGMVTATEAAMRDMDALMGKLETCRQSPISMAGWLEQATKLTPFGAKLDTDHVLEATETALAAEWSHTSGVNKGLWNRARNVVTEADMQLRTYGQILELDYSVINSRQPHAPSRGR